MAGRRYKVNGTYYNIPEEKTDAFEKRYPDAEVFYSNGNDQYGIPLSKRQAFEKTFPNAVYYTSEKGNDHIYEAGDVEGSTSKAGPKAQEVTDEYDSFKRMNAQNRMQELMRKQDNEPKPRKTLQDIVSESSTPVEQNILNREPISREPAYTKGEERNYRPDIFERMKYDSSIRDEDAAVDKEYTPKVEEKEEDVFENYRNRFGLTQRGAELQEELAQIQSNLQNKYSKEFENTPEYKAIVGKKYNTQEEIDAANKALNDAYNKKYGAVINKEMEPYLKAYEGEIFQRYAPRIQEGLRTVAKNDTSKEVKALTGEVDELLEKQHKILRSKGPSSGNAMSALMGSRTYNQSTAKERQELGALEASQRLLEQSQEIIEEAGKKGNTNFFAGLGRGFRDNMDIENFTFGLSEMADSKYLNRALEKAEKGEKLTPAEEKLLEASVVNMATYGYFSSDLGRGYGAGSTTAVSLPFMLEFIANPISGSGNAIAKGLLKFGLKKFGRASAQTASKGALNAFGRGIASNTGKFAGRLAGDAAAALGMEGTTGLGRVAAGTLDRLKENYDYSLDDNGQLQVRKTGNTSIGGAFARSAASTFFDNQSEMVLNAFKGWSPFMKAVDKALPGRMNEFLNRIKNSKPGELYRELKNNPTFREIVKRAQFHGQGEEYLEEVYNNLANVAMGEMTMEDALDLDNNIDTFLGLAPTSVMFGLFGLGSMAADKFSNRKKMRALFEKMTPEQQAKLTELTQMSKERGNEDIKKFIEVTIADKDLTTEQKKDEIEYAFELAKQNAIEDLQQEQTPEGRAADDAYVQGTELPVEQRYSAEQERVVAEEALREVDENALNTIDRMLADDASANEIEEIISGMDEESAKLARDYYNKSMRINGIVDSARDDAEEAVASFEASLQEAIILDAEGNGTITTATLMSGAGEVKEEVYVIANDGVQATILQKDGTKKMVNPGLLDNVQTSLANDVVQLYQDQIGEQMRDQTDMSLNHHPKTRVPQPGMQIWNGDMSLIITEVNADGSVRAFPAVLNNKTGLMEPKNGSTPVDMSAKESLDLQDDYYNKMDAASIGVNLSEKEGENAIVSRDEESKVSGKEAVQISEGRNISEEDMVGRGLTEDEAGKFVMDMELNAETAPEIELTPENWIAEFGSEGILSTPLGNVKMGNNQYLKLSQQGRNGKLGMIKPTLTNPDVIIEDESRARNGEQERDSSYVFVKAFTDKNGKRVYYFTSVTVKKGGNEVVISNQEKGIKRISKLLQNGKVAWIKPYDSLHPTSQEEKPVSLDETNGPTSNGNQPALLGINSPVVSENKDTQKSSENQEVNVNNSIQFDEKGNPLYHKAPVETTVAYLSDGSLTDEEIDLIVAANQAEANKQLEKIIKDTPKIVTNKEKYVAAKKAWQAKVDDARQQSEYWKEVASFIKQQREQPGDKITEEILSMGEPLNELELAAQKLANGSLPLLYEDYKRELGFSNKEVGKMFGLFKSRENGGLTIEEAGEVLMQNDLEEGTNFFDQEDANAGRNAILEVLSSARTRGDLIEYIRKKREAASERERRSEEEYDENQRDAWYEEHYSMSYADYVTFEEVINDIIQEKALSKEAIQEFYDNFADEFNNWNNGRITEETTVNERGSVGSRSESSEGLLPTEQLSDNRGIETDISAEADERADNKGVPASEESIITEIETAREQVDTNPSDAQKEAGNYKKGHIKLDGYDITIENPKGSERSGTDADGNKWSITMNNDYGYIRGTESIDGDHIDIFLSDNPAEGNVYVIDQLNTTTGEFDEHKVMYGFSSRGEAMLAYLLNYSPGWQGLGAISEVSKDEFKKWIDSSHRKTKPFADYKSVKVKEAQIESQGKITSEPVSQLENGGKTEVKLPQSKSNAKNKKKAADIKQARYELMDAKRELSVAQATNSGYTPEEVEEKKKRVEKAENELKEFTNKVSNDSIRFREIKDGDITSFAQKYNLDESDVGKYAKSMNVGNLGGASYAFKNIKRSIRLLNSNLSLGEFVKVFAPVKADLYEKFGNVDALRDEYVQQEIEQRNVMEAARKRAEEEAETERKRLEEFELMTDTEMDASYFKALEENDEPRMRDIVNEAARRKGYVSADEFRMAHRAPSYDEEGYDKSMVDVANDKDNIRQSLNEQLKMNRDTYKDESAFAINEALSAIDEGKHPTVTIYRAVPKSLKEGRVRNGDWVSLSESYVKTHGEHALNGDYRIIKEEVPAENLYWDGNDINEWGYDDRSDYRYKDTKNNRKLSDLITRDDNGNIIPPSKRFNARKADTRYRLIGEQETANLDEVTKQREIIQTVEDLSDKLNTPIHITRSLDEIPDGSAKRAIEEGRKVKAWFDTGTREVFFYIPNATDVNDAKVSILHEVVGHKGLRNLFGTENETKFDSMMMDLFEKLPLNVRSEIADMAVSRYANNVSVAMDEYLAEQAEKDETPGWWDRVVSAIRDFFRKMGVDVKLSENDVKYLLWRSRKKLETGDLFEQAKDVVMRNKLGIGLNETQETSESAPTESTRFREVEDEKNPLNKEMLSAWDNLAASTAFQLKETGVDYLTAVDKFTKLIADKTNSRVLDYENAYHALLALSSKNREEMNWYDSFVAKPLNDAIYNLVGGKKVRKRLNWDKDVLRDLVVYVESKHGIERNRQVAVENFINGYSFSSFKEIEQLGIPFDIDAYNKELKSIKDKVYKEAYDKAYDEYLNKYIDEGIEEKDASDKADKSAKNKADKAQSKASDSFRDKVKSDLTEKAREIMSNRWEEKKRNILNNTELTWLEKQTELDKAAALLGADLSKDYSGLSSVFKDSEDWKQAAYDNVLSYEGAHDKADLENLWSAVRNATNYALNKQLNTGLVSKEYVERQQKRFENYIPLRGFNDEIAGDVYSYLNNDVFAQGSPVKSMDGRTSEAGNPFGSILQIGYSSIAVGNKNIAKQRFYNFVSNHDTEGVAVVNNVWMIDYETLKSHPELKQISVKEEEEVPGMVEAVPDIPANATAEQISSILSSFEETMKELEKEGKAQTVKGKSKIAYRTLHGERSEHEIPLFIGGNRYVITITGNPRVAQAINGLTNPDSYGNVFEEFNKRMKRFMAGSFTSFNLPFAFANLSKDTMYANNQAFIRENRKWWWAFTKNQASYANPVNVAIMLMKYQKGTLDTNNKSERYFKEFMENGGATGYTFVETQKEYADKIGKILKELASGKKKLPEKLVKDYLFGSIEFLGQAAEVTNRYAAFRTSRELGRSISRSVNDAKDITVNFNRKGAGSKTKSPNNKTIVNLAAGLSEYGRRYILFWNAAMQSKYMLYKNLKEHPIKTSTTLIAGNIALGATIPFLNNMLLPALFEVFGWGSDDDKEDYYDVLTDYERQHNIMIRLPKGLGWFKFPLSPEFVPFYSIGDMITGSLSGKRKLDPLDIVKSAIDAASPLNIQWEYSGWKFFLNFLPTVVQPGVQNMVNVNFMGSPLAKTPINREAKNEPEFKNVFKNESPALIELSRLTNKLSGGDDVVRGAVSWNPAYVRNLITGYSGGWGGTFLSIADWMVGTANGEKQTVLASQTPFVSRFLSSGNKDVKLKRINSNYQDVVDFYSKIKHDERGYEKKIDETKDYFEQAEYQSKLNKLLDSEEYGRYQDLENIVETIKDQEELLKDDPDDEQLRDELYASKLKAIEIYHREKE